MSSSIPLRWHNFCLTTKCYYSFGSSLVRVASVTVMILTGKYCASCLGVAQKAGRSSMTQRDGRTKLSDPDTQNNFVRSCENLTFMCVLFAKKQIICALRKRYIGGKTSEGKHLLPFQHFQGRKWKQSIHMQPLKHEVFPSLYRRLSLIVQIISFFAITHT